MNKKILLINVLLITLFMIFAFASVVNAADAGYGKVSLRSGTGTILPSDTNADVTVTYQHAQLAWAEADPDIGRDVDGYWIGIQVDAPEGINKTSSTIDATTSNGTTHFVYDNVKDNETYVTLWKRVDNTVLDSEEEEITLIQYEFNWVKDGADATKVTKDAVELDETGTVTVTIGSHKFTLTEGKSLSDLTTSEMAILYSYSEPTEAGVIFSHFEDEEGNIIEFDDAITEDITLHAVFAEDPDYKEPTEPSTESKEDELDESPKTGVESAPIAIVSAVALISLAGIIVIEKK